MRRQRVNVEEKWDEMGKIDEAIKCKCIWKYSDMNIYDGTGRVHAKHIYYG